MKRIQLNISGMTCRNCEAKVAKTLASLKSVSDVKPDFVKGQVLLNIENVAELSKVVSTLKDIGYEVTGSIELVEKASYNKTVLSQAAGLISIVAIVMLISPAINIASINIDSTATMGTLFVVGVLTSVHCIGMCGGINLAQCINYQNATGSSSVIEPSLLYNMSRVFSYTLVGALAGALGSAFNISLHLKGIISLVAGLLMVIMGLNLLGLMSGLRSLMPRMPHIKLPSSAYGPVIVGLLNGFMPCGPLQAVQLYALSTGSAVQGALAMFFFGLGTVPAMFGFGSFSTALGKRFTSNILKASGIFVIVLGVIAAQRGLGLIDFKPTTQPLQQVVVKMPQGTKIAEIKDGYQEVYVNVAPRGYEPIAVQIGIPVKMIFVVAPGNLNGCNNAIIIPSLNIQKPLIVGETTVEFTPQQVGEIRYACWMNMIRSTITVVEDLSKVK